MESDGYAGLIDRETGVVGTSTTEQLIDAEAREVSRNVVAGNIDRDSGIAAILELAERSRIHDKEGAAVGRRFGISRTQVARDASEAYRDIIVDKILNPEAGWDFDLGAKSSFCGALRQLARKSVWVGYSAGRPRSTRREILTDYDTDFSTLTESSVPEYETEDSFDEAIEHPKHVRPFAAIRALVDREAAPLPIRPTRLAERAWLKNALESSDDMAARSLTAFKSLVTGSDCRDLETIDERLLAIWDSMTVEQVEALEDLGAQAVSLIASYTYRDFVYPSKTVLRQMRSECYGDVPSRKAEWKALVRDLVDAFCESDTDGINPQDRKTGADPVPMSRRSDQRFFTIAREAIGHPGSPLGASPSEVYDSVCAAWEKASLRMMVSRGEKETTT